MNWCNLPPPFCGHFLPQSAMSKHGIKHEVHVLTLTNGLALSILSSFTMTLQCQNPLATNYTILGSLFNKYQLMLTGPHTQSTIMLYTELDVECKEQSTIGRQL